MNNHHRYNQPNQQHNQYQQHQVNQGQGASSGDVQQRKKEFLWRERMKLELQLQGLQASATVLSRQWQQVQARKAASGKQVLKVAGLILLSALVGMRHAPAERRYEHEKQWIAQEEWRLQQEFIRCNGQIAAVQAQIQRLDFELFRL